MAITSYMSIGGTVANLPSGTRSIATPTSVNTSAPGTTSMPALSGGDNTITIPTGTEWVMIVPASTNTAVLTLKGDAADVGLELSKTRPALISVNTGTTSLILNASAGVSAGVVELSFL